MLCCGEYGDMLNVCAIDNKAIVTVHHDICDTPSKYEEGHNISSGVTDISLRVFYPLTYQIIVTLQVNLPPH